MPYEHILISFAKEVGMSVVELEQYPFWVARIAEHIEAMGWAQRRYTQALKRRKR